MSSAIERFDERVRRRFSRYGTTIIHRGELLRHPVYTRLLHWTVAIFFILSLLSGFAIYSPWLFHWLTPLFGGGTMTRLVHPWFALAFSIAFLFQFLNWLRPMRWTSSDSKWLRRVKEYALNRDRLEPAYTGFFNAGEKLYFWTIVFSVILFLITGILMWFDHIVPRWIVAGSYVIHGIAALVMLGGFIIHVYQTTASQPGTFRSMVDGTVTEEWAWTHHPAWYQEVTGRDPVEAYESALRRQNDRSRPVEDRVRPPGTPDQMPPSTDRNTRRP
jgi:formate dehydrogenase subunit gamma